MTWFLKCFVKYRLKDLPDECDRGRDILGWWLGFGGLREKSIVGCCIAIKGRFLQYPVLPLTLKCMQLSRMEISLCNKTQQMQTIHIDLDIHHIPFKYFRANTFNSHVQSLVRLNCQPLKNKDDISQCISTSLELGYFIYCQFTRLISFFKESYKCKRLRLRVVHYAFVGTETLLSRVFDCLLPVNLLQHQTGHAHQRAKLYIKMYKCYELKNLNHTFKKWVLLKKGVK